MPDQPLTIEEVGRLLRELRKAAGLPVATAAKRAGIAQSSLTRYEKGRFVPAEDKMRALLAQYRPDRRTRAQLLASSHEHQPTYKRVVAHRGAAAKQRELVGRESETSRIATFSPTVIPGLLQTEGYMRALLGDRVPAPEVGPWIANRLERQAILRQPDRNILQITTVGALLWSAGTDTMLEQLDHIAELTRLDTARVGVIPAAVDTGEFPLHAFDLYQYRDRRTPLVEFGTHGGLITITDPVDVAVYEQMLTALEGAAVFGEKVRDVLAEVRRWYEHDG